MLPEAKNEDLLYVSSLLSGDVSVFSYPGGRLVGTLRGLGELTGICVDRSQNVFLATWGGGTITPEVLEYAHGGTSQLAVASSYGPSGDGTLVVYDGGSSHATVYTDRAVYNFFFCTYDSAGNLFVDGEPDRQTGIVLAELRRGARKLKNLALPKRSARRWRGRVRCSGAATISPSAAARATSPAISRSITFGSAASKRPSSGPRTPEVRAIPTASRTRSSAPR